MLLPSALLETAQLILILGTADAGPAMFFMCMDPDGSGRISPEEACQAIKCEAVGLTVQGILDHVDLDDNDNNMGMSEFDADLAAIQEENSGVSLVIDTSMSCCWVTLLPILPCRARWSVDDALAHY